MIPLKVVIAPTSKKGEWGGKTITYQNHMAGDSSKVRGTYIPKNASCSSEESLVKTTILEQAKSPTSLLESQPEKLYQDKMKS